MDAEVSDELPAPVVELITRLREIHKGAEISSSIRSAMNKHCGEKMYVVQRGSVRGGVYYLICGKCGFYSTGRQETEFGDGSERRGL